MSNYAVGMVAKHSRAKGSPRLVLLLIADVTDEVGRNAWCSPDNLAMRARLTARAVRLILHKLEREGELVIEINAEGRSVSKGYVPPRFMHIRCVFDPAGYAHVESEKFTETPFAVGRPAKRQTFPISVHENRKSFPRNRNASVPKSENSRTAYKEDPSVDPLVELRAGPAALPPSAPTENTKVITRLVHEVLDLHGDDYEDGELRDAVKRRCASLRIAYDSAVVNRAIDSAKVQRSRTRRPA